MSVFSPNQGETMRKTEWYTKRHFFRTTLLFPHQVTLLPRRT